MQRQYVRDLVNTGVTGNSKKVLKNMDKFICQATLEDMENYLANKEVKTLYSHMFLFLAIKYGRAELVQLLFDNGTDISAEPPEQYFKASNQLQTSYLIQAIISEDEATMDLVLQAGADTTKTGIICKSTSDNHVWTNAIGAAAFLGNAHILPKLLKAQPSGVDHLATESNDRFGLVKQEFSGYTPLMLAVASEDKCLECVKLLLKAGADLNKQDFFGDTIGHIAGMNKNNRILDYLVNEAGIDLNQPNHRGETPL